MPPDTCTPRPRWSVMVYDGSALTDAAPPRWASATYACGRMMQPTSTALGADRGVTEQNRCQFAAAAFSTRSHTFSHKRRRSRLNAGSMGGRCRPSAPFPALVHQPVVQLGAPALPRPRLKRAQGGRPPLSSPLGYRRSAGGRQNSPGWQGRPRIASAARSRSLRPGMPGKNRQCYAGPQCRPSRVCLPAFIARAVTAS